jgi:hypothetical protein
LQPARIGKDGGGVCGEGEGVEIANRWNQLHAVGNINTVCGDRRAGSRVCRENHWNTKHVSCALQCGERRRKS